MNDVYLPSVKASRYRFLIIHYVRNTYRNIVHHITNFTRVARGKKKPVHFRYVPTIARLVDDNVFFAPDGNLTLVFPPSGLCETMVA